MFEGGEGFGVGVEGAGVGHFGLGVEGLKRLEGGGVIGNSEG